MKSAPGTYALMLRCPSKAVATVGRLGQIDLKRGYYIYVGSAFGPGGVRARVTRHCRADKALRWHIDYLREFVTPLGAWYSHAPTHLEHVWAQHIGAMSGVSSIPNFGCSDCRCASHLFYTARPPDMAGFVALAGGEVETWSYG